MAALVINPSSRWARYSSGMTAERFCSGGYFAKIFFISSGYFSASINLTPDRYLPMETLAVHISQNNINTADNGNQIGHQYAFGHQRDGLQVIK